MRLNQLRRLVLGCPNCCPKMNLSLFRHLEFLSPALELFLFLLFLSLLVFLLQQELLLFQLALVLLEERFQNRQSCLIWKFHLQWRLLRCSEVLCLPQLEFLLVLCPRIFLGLLRCSVQGEFLEFLCFLVKNRLAVLQVPAFVFRLFFQLAQGFLSIHRIHRVHFCFLVFRSCRIPFLKLHLKKFLLNYRLYYYKSALIFYYILKKNSTEKKLYVLFSFALKLPKFNS